jgi:hypothetical protein
MKKDEDFNEYVKELKSKMWKGLGFAFILGLVILLLVGICYK